MNDMWYYEKGGGGRIKDKLLYIICIKKKNFQNSRHWVKRLPAHLNLQHLRSVLQANHSRLAGCYLLHP